MFMMIDVPLFHNSITFRDQGKDHSAISGILETAPRHSICSSTMSRGTIRFEAPTSRAPAHNFEKEM